MSAALPKDMDEIEERVEEYKRYKRMGNIASDYWLLWFSLSLVLYVLLRPIIFYAPVEPLEVFFPISVPAVISLLILTFAYKKMKKYHLEDDEWVTYYTNSLSESLEDCVQAKNNELKKDLRKEALGIAEEFLSYVRERWSYGRFKLATDYFGDSLEEFKKSLQFRLIPNIKDGDEEVLMKARQIMYNLLWGHPSVDLIKALNRQMSGLPNREPLKMGMRNRLSTFLIVHKTMRDGLAVVLSSAVVIAFYSLAIYFQWASRDYVFTGSLALFGILLTIYFTKLRKTD